MKSLLSVALFVFSVVCNLPSQADDISFTRDIRPILSSKCYKCHGPDEDARVTEMRLDTEHGLFETVDAPVTPGNLRKSVLAERILAEDPDIRMPPASSNKVLTDEELQLLTQWIKQGAKYEPHWAFQVPQNIPPQQPRKSSWGTNSIDKYVASRLATAGLQPSATANPNTLIRRLYLDLLGIPPTPEELVDAISLTFNKHGEINRQEYAGLVDQLLERPQYGERWARRWLDLARYADTNGYEKDRDRNMWPYRDWVIHAINSGMTFDQFTIEQIAGDMLPDATTDQRVATGFHRNTMLNEEGGIDPLEFRFYAMTDRVATTGTTWLGLTTGCAQCHTHKYDPITHRQYYELMAFMNNTDEPELDIPDGILDNSYAESLAKATELLQQLPAKYPLKGTELETEFQLWLNQQRQRIRNWIPITPVRMITNLPHLQAEPEHIIFASGDSTKHDIFELEFDVTETEVRAIRLEALPDPRLPNYGPGMTNYEGTIGDFFLTEFELHVDDQPVQMEKAVHSYAKNRYGNQDTSAQLMIDGDIQTGWSVHDGQGQRHVSVIAPAKPVKAGHWKLRMHFGRHFSSSLGKFRLSIATDNKPLSATELPVASERLLLLPDAEQTDEQRNTLLSQFLLQTAELKEQADRILALQTRPRYQRALVMQERPLQNPRPTHRHHRGEFLSPREEVTPQPLNFLHQYPDDLPRNRLGFARWLVSPENPLTSRVVANRQWDAFFGKGIVATLDDFGFQGSPPTHPLLLDHLATQLVANNWSLRWLHKYIVTSATYQQSSRVKTDARAVDPENQLLSYFPRVRLDAEVFRDAVLQSSGLLSLKMYGPPVRPLQPDGIAAAAYGSPKWIPSTGEDRYRRSLYTYTKRTAPFAMFNTFDAPSGEFCTARRNKSNTALQALTVLNDVMFLDIARQFGTEISRSEDSQENKIRMAFVRVLCRPPTEIEKETIQDYFDSLEEQYRAVPEDATILVGIEGSAAIEAAAWTGVVRVLFSTDEAINKN
ncbi:MAG: hypothetical protein CMJ76_13580 [Planctomycetaceae bacterium]|nr:hypothetical protein [Planctomycetaceae bacterium]